MVAADAATVDKASAQAATKRNTMSNNPQPAIIRAADLGKQVSTGDMELTILAGVSFEVRTGEAVGRPAKVALSVHDVREQHGRLELRPIRNTRGDPRASAAG